MSSGLTVLGELPATVYVLVLDVSKNKVNTTIINSKDDTTLPNGNDVTAPHYNNTVTDVAGYSNNLVLRGVDTISKCIVSITVLNIIPNESEREWPGIDDPLYTG